MGNSNKQDKVSKLKWDNNNKMASSKKTNPSLKTNSSNSNNSKVLITIIQIKVSISNSFVNPNFIDIDWKAFENECRGVVNDIAEKFIDLGLDEGNHSEYGQDLI